MVRARQAGMPVAGTARTRSHTRMLQIRAARTARAVRSAGIKRGAW